MNWLFWKEYRQNRVVVIALLVMMVVPYLFGFYAVAYEWHLSWQQLLLKWREILIAASLYSLGISQVALALIGGNAIAGERADRSAEFQVYLPLAREKILAAKLLLVLAIAAVIWLINPLLIWGAGASAKLLMPVGLVRFVMINTAITGFVFFCVAWFFSTILRSPTFSVAAGLITPLIIISVILFGGYLILGERGGPEDGVIIQICYVCISLAVAFPSFGLGTWLYLRRVEA
jgi:ABC-type transport system involved in multi-copper enzyme maturation permease subunit